MEVTLRPLRRTDFAMLAGWLREPLVAEWWHDDPTGDALARQYGPAIAGAEPTVLRIGLVDGEPAGLVQWYRLDDEPEYAAELRPWLPVPRGAWSLDYLLAGSRFRGRGVASDMLRLALRAIGPAEVIVPVHERNAASQALLRRVGFVRVATARLEPDNPVHSRAHAVLVRRHGAAALSTGRRHPQH